MEHNIKFYKLKIICFTMVFIFLLSIVFSCSKINLEQENLNNVEKSYLQEKKEIIFTGQKNYAPFEYIDENGEYTGITIELIRWISTEFGFRTRFVPLQFNEAQKAVLNGQADVITSLFYSRKREEKFDFSQTVFEVPAAIFTYINRYNINSINDLKNKKIAIQVGDYAEDYLREKKINVDFVPVRDFYEAIDNIVDLKVDAVIGDEQVVWFHIFSRNYVNFVKKIGDPLYIGQNCMAVGKDNAVLLSIINKGISRAKNESILDKLTQKWIGSSQKKINLFTEYKIYILIGGLIFLFIIIFLVVGNIWLQKELKKNIDAVGLKNVLIEESEERLRNLVNAIPDIICLRDVNNLIIEANRAFIDFFNLSDINLKNILIDDLILKVHPRYKTQLIQFFLSDDLVWMMKKEWRKEQILINKNEETRTFDILKVPLYDYNQNKKGMLIIGRDITESKIVSEELTKIQKLNSLGIIAGRIAHDFNNILGGITGNLSLAKYHLNDPEELKNLLTEAETASQSAKRISNQLLTFSKGGKPVKEVLDPLEILKEAVVFTLRGSKSNYTINRESEKIWSIIADRHQLIQAINNILLNADQSMPGGGNIKIGIRNDYIKNFLTYDIYPGNYLIIAIEDQGTGIQDEIAEKIFDPFFTTKKQGNGLGLSSVYNICRNHEGHVFFDNKRDKGTVFYLVFPSTGKILAKRGKHPVDISEKFNYRICLLDDDEMILKTAEKLFNFFDCQVTPVRNHVELWKILSANEFDVCILDLIIPGSKGGEEIISEIREKFPDMIYIVSSGYSNNPVMSNYKKYGFDFILIKPYHLDDVEKLCKEIGQKIHEKENN